ncbi:MAG: ribose 5-phosphate isomerase B [Bacteroidetes bacterium]|nr:ribose 5-phosphate isomerase B [Bacteroidota bacterium]
MIIAIACDHAGFELKENLTPFLQSELGFKLIDLGTNSPDSVDYPDFAHALAAKVEHNEAAFGILICGSGNGVCITANKHKGVRAAMAWLPEIATLARQHNDANVICLPARYISTTDAEAILKAFFSATFEGGRHERRVEKI